MSTLKTQLIHFFKENSGHHLGVNLQHHKFPTNKKGFYSPAYIDRELRRLVVEGRLENHHANGLVEFTYKRSKEEIYHANMQLL